MLYWLQNMKTQVPWDSRDAREVEDRAVGWPPHTGKGQGLSPLPQAPLLAKGGSSACSPGLAPARGPDACGKCGQKEDEAGPGEVVSGSQIGAGGRRPGHGPHGPKVPARPPAPLQVPSVLMPALEGDTWRQERSPAEVSPFFRAQVGGAAETLPGTEAAQSGGHARRRGQDTCQGLCTNLSKKMYMTSKHQSVPQVSPVPCKDPKAALRAGG